MSFAAAVDLMHYSTGLNSQILQSLCMAFQTQFNCLHVYQPDQQSHLTVDNLLLSSLIRIAEVLAVIPLSDDQPQTNQITNRNPYRCFDFAHNNSIGSST